MEKLAIYEISIFIRKLILIKIQQALWKAWRIIKKKR